jgi:RNA:NAD 2'-phosphotransferase (TPT1/KptA family)
MTTSTAKEIRFRSFLETRQRCGSHRPAFQSNSADRRARHAGAVRLTHRRPSNYEKPLGSKGYSNLEGYLIPVIKLMWSGLDHNGAFNKIAQELDVRRETVRSQCVRALDLTTDEFVLQVNSKAIVDLLERKYPDKYQLIKTQLK